MESKAQLGPHQLLFKEGDVAKKLFLIKKGQVLCLKSSKDRLIPVFMAKPGDVVGESAMVETSTNTYSAITFTDVELVEVPTQNFTSILKNAPEWLVELTTTMISRFQSTANLIAENRVIHPSILSEADYTSTLEVEFKRLVQ